MSSKDEMADDENDEVVRKLAARLAPTLEQAEELLALPPEFDKDVTEKSPGVVEDDDMDQELQDLANAEDMLRRELEDIQAFSNLFRFPITTAPETPASQPAVAASEWQSPSIQSTTTTNTPKATPKQSPLVASNVEADMDGEQDTALEQKYVPSSSSLKRTVVSPTRTPRSNRKATHYSSPSLLRMGNQTIPYNTDDHQRVLGVERNLECGWYTVDLTRHVVVSSQHPPGHGLEEICVALPPTKLQPWFIGLQGAVKASSGSSGQNQTNAPLPVRTLTIRIRPDVLCGAVMDAVTTSLRSAKIWKRQGGHLRALLRSQYDEENAKMFVVDAQVVTFKSMECRRVLLIRIYHSDAHFPDRDPDEEEALAESAPPSMLDSPMAEGAMDPAANLHLREACALLERIEYPSTSNKALHRPAQSPSMSDRETMSQSVRKHLLDHYQACPSVKLGQPTLPSLNADDWPIVQAAWPWIYDVWSELGNRDQTFTTLITSCAFGKFPSLSTLDVHYCSQIRRFSRETMVIQLLKSASDLEEYARQAEYACANMISLLQPTFEAYEIDAPALPEPVPLTSYPLDFVPPQTECPPWGIKVMEALNHVQAATSKPSPGGNEMDNLFTGEMPTSLSHLDPAAAKDSLKRAQEAVHMVVTAFQQQDDEEKGARLARKNVQVMDRLSKMEEYQRRLVLALSQSNSPKVLHAAGDLKSRVGLQEVPLLKWTVVVGSSTGSCWITARHIAFSTQLIPVLGSTTRQIFEWEHISLGKIEQSPSILNPLSVSIQIQSRNSGETLYTFRPSVSGARLYSFLKVFRDTAASLPLKEST